MKCLQGSEKEFHDFINLISKKDKIGIITHIDLDGIASGVFLQKILESKNLKVDFIEFLDIDENALKNAIKNKEVNKLFITDWAADNFQENFEFLRKKYDVFLIDHHPINENLKDKKNIIKTKSGTCSAHCIFNLAKNYFNTKDWEWLVCSAIIFDYCFVKQENFEFVKSIYPKTEKEKIWMSEPAKIGSKIANALIYYQPNFKKVYNLVLKKDFKKLEKAENIIEEEVKKWIEKFKQGAEYFPEKKLYFYYGTPKHRITSKVASMISTRNLDKTILFVSDNQNKEGFVKLSARNQSGNVQLGIVLKKCVEEFEDSNAGGHDQASAGGFPKKYLNEFKENLLKEL